MAMSITGAGRFVRAAFRNAVVWGAAWFAGSMLFLTTRLLVGMAPPGIGMMDNVGMSIRVGIAGGLAGAAFASFLRVAFRGRKLAELNWVKFGIGGAIGATALILGLMVVPRLLMGEGPPPLSDISTDIWIALVFGGVTAAGSLRLAQMADQFVPGESSRIPELSEGEAAPLYASREREGVRRESD
jgi:hypothetical protein